MDILKVVVVDDSALFRTLIRNALQDIGGCDIVATANDGPAALQKIVELEPDFVTLDVEMPNMDGIAVLQELKRRRIRTKVVMVSRLTSSGAQTTTDALLHGAFDFILKPSGKDPAVNKAELVAALAEKLAAVRGALESAGGAPSPATPRPAGITTIADVDAVVIGCSTGGPDALGHIIPFLRPDFPVPIVVVQHMPERFTTSLSQRLDEASELTVMEAADGMRLKPGLAVIARGGQHLQLSKRGRLVVAHLTDDPREHNCRPAVDYTLRSAVEVWDGRLLVVILTGMGRDGTDGCRLVRSRGGHVFAQDAASCAVFGMPKAVIAAGEVDRIVSLSEIAASIETAVRKPPAR